MENKIVKAEHRVPGGMKLGYGLGDFGANMVYQSVMLYLIRRGGTLQIEHDRHITGLFPLRTWLELMEEAGFSVQKLPCHQDSEPRQSILLAGTLKQGRSGQFRR